MYAIAAGGVQCSVAGCRSQVQGSRVCCTVVTPEEIEIANSRI